MTFLRMRDKCKIIAVQRKDKAIMIYGLFVRTYITAQQSYLSQTNTRQTSFEACFDSKRKSRDCRRAMIHESDLNKRNILLC